VLVDGWLAERSEGSIDETPNPVAAQAGKTSHSPAKAPKPLVIVEAAVSLEEVPEGIDDLPDDIHVSRREICRQSSEKTLQPVQTIRISLSRQQQGHGEICKRPIPLLIAYIGETKGSD
jgi:hypothetical protein